MRYNPFSYAHASLRGEFHTEPHRRQCDGRPRRVIRPSQLGRGSDEHDQVSLPCMVKEQDVALSIYLQPTIS